MQYYKVFYTDTPLPPGVTVPDFSMILPFEFVTKDEALNKAFKLIHSGAIVWKIDGPGGYHLDRPAVETAYRVFRAS